MKAARIPQFGPASVITNGDLPQPEVAAEQLLVRVKAAGVGNWDALIREGKVALQPLPLILGSELSGIVEGIGVQTANDLPSRFWAQEKGHFGLATFNSPFGRLRAVVRWSLTRVNLHVADQVKKRKY